MIKSEKIEKEETLSSKNKDGIQKDNQNEKKSDLKKEETVE